MRHHFTPVRIASNNQQRANDGKDTMKRETLSFNADGNFIWFTLDYMVDVSRLETEKRKKVGPER